MKIKFSKLFLRSYKKLPNEIQRRFEIKLRLFKQNSRHPSLRVKKVKGQKDPKIFEGSITMSYRFLFRIKEDTYEFINCGKHEDVF